MKCSFCKDIITCTDSVENIPDNHIYIKGISRGSLLYPDDIVVNTILYNYIVINKLTQHPEFLKSANQRNVATQISMDVLVDADIFFQNDCCDAAHSTQKIIKMLVWASSNALLNNYCTKENDAINQNKKSGKKRKLQTLTP